MPDPQAPADPNLPPTPTPEVTPNPSPTTPEPTLLSDPPADPTKPTEVPPAPAANELVGAPEAYEDFTLPEGITLEGETLTEAQTLFKELNVSQKGAQRLVDAHAKIAQSVVEKMIEKSNNTRTEWRDAVKADPQIGPNLTQVKETIGRMYDSWGDAKLVNEFKEAMNLTGVGDNPAFIKALYKMAQTFTEGRPVQPGGPPSPARRGGPQAMYPNLPSSANG